MYLAENWCLIPNLSQSSSTLVFLSSLPLSLLTFLMVVSNSLCILLTNDLKVAKASLLSLRKNTHIYLVKSSIITNPYLFPPMLVYVVGPNKFMCNYSNALYVPMILFFEWVLPTCFLGWHALQSLSFSNVTSFKPLTRSCLTNLFNCFIPTWPSLLCHNCWCSLNAYFSHQQDINAWIKET